MTLKDIAQEAGVSAVTISNVINGNYKKVSAETVERVQKIIEKYNYTPSATARSLAKKESKIIGVIISYVADNHSFLESPYNAEILGVLEQNIRNHGYFMMVRSAGTCMESIPLFETWNVDGMIFLGASQDEVTEIQKQMSLPMVFMDSYCSDIPMVNIGADDYKGGYLATKYMMLRGHRQIAFAGPSIDSPGVIRERFHGYTDALKERQLPKNSDMIYEAPTSYESGIELGRKIAFAKELPTAVVSMSDILALGIMEGLRLSGKTVPEDISVIGYDNLTECRYSTPKLTTINQHITEKAHIAAQFLFEMIQTKVQTNRQETLDVEVVERESVRTL